MKNLQEKLFFGFVILLITGFIFVNYTLMIISVILLIVAFIIDWNDPRNMMGGMS
jgi:hypothetical protein